MYRAQFRLSAMVQENRLIDPTDPALRVSISLEDAKLIASSVTAAQWATVADTLGALDVVNSRHDVEAREAAAGFSVALERDAREMLPNTSEALKEADRALAPLAESE